MSGHCEFELERREIEAPVTGLTLANPHTFHQAEKLRSEARGGKAKHDAEIGSSTDDTEAEHDGDD